MMGANTVKQKKTLNVENDISVSEARTYITDMLSELCMVADQSGQEDLLVLLKLTTQAARNAVAD